MKFLHFAAAALGAAVAVSSASLYAQKYPAKPVRIVVPYAAGGPLDDVARYLGQKLSSRWGQPVLVDTRGGSGGAVGAELVAKSPPDGYTLLLGNGGPITVYPHLRKKPNYDPERSFEPVTWVVTSPMLLVVHPSTPMRSVPLRPRSNCEAEAGRLRAVGVSSAKPSGAAPGVPSIASAYPGST